MKFFARRRVAVSSPYVEARDAGRHRAARIAYCQHRENPVNARIIFCHALNAAHRAKYPA